MPFIEGDSLRDRFSREPELPAPKAVRLFRDVVDAPAAARCMGVVHRDIKPQDILLSRRHSIVADFGVTTAVSDATRWHRRTRLGLAVDTPSFVAPEEAVVDTNGQAVPPSTMRSGCEIEPFDRPVLPRRVVLAGD